MYKRQERTIGADIMMAFDECTPGDSDYEYAKKSLGLTHRWLDRCIQRFNETEPKYGYNQSLLVMDFYFFQKAEMLGICKIFNNKSLFFFIFMVYSIIV